MNQFDDDVTEYLSLTKNLYKDLIAVAKDQETGEVKTQSFVFRVSSISQSSGAKMAFFEKHPQDCLYVLVDPLHWHATVFAYRWKSAW